MATTISTNLSEINKKSLSCQILMAVNMTNNIQNKADMLLWRQCGWRRNNPTLSHWLTHGL